MILKLFMNLSILVLNFFASLIPDFTSNYLTYLTSILSWGNQVGNFMHFLFGDTISLIAPSIIGLIGFKFVVLPIIIFARGFIRFRILEYFMNGCSERNYLNFSIDWSLSYVRLFVRLGPAYRLVLAGQIA